MKKFCELLCCLQFAILSGSLAIDIDYLTTSCNAANLYVATSRRVESSTSLIYSSDMSCTYGVYVDAGKYVYLVADIFRLEHEVSNVCVDYVNIYDGATATGTPLNPSPLCGSTIDSAYISNSNYMTIEFVTDSKGNEQGFGFNFVAVTNGTCGSDQYSCSTGVCIDSSLVCNNFDECGNEVDETNCPATDSGSSTVDNAALIAGLTIGLSVAVVIAVVIGLYCWRYHRWRVYIKRPIMAAEVVHSETTFTTAYPVTKYYYKEHWQDLYRDPEKPKYYGYQGETVVTTEHGTKPIA